MNCKILRISCFFVVMLINVKVSAQIFADKKYPQDYFQWPVMAKIGIAANFGELRPNHYHMGLDCRTDQKQNMPVVAAADGYIAKVKIDQSGFGRAIYVNHPNGLTTLYAHLNDFDSSLEKYVTDQQYKLQQWDVSLDIPADLFPVHKGQFIAYSGNTGGSQGPHTHFEIRNTKTDKVLNPLLFNLPIADTIPPDILRLVMYDRNSSTYEQSPKFITVKKVKGQYIVVPSLITTASNKISFGITAYDRYTGSSNRNGIYEGVIYEDDQPLAGFQLDNISYDETRYVNANIDYKLRSSGGSFVQHLSKLSGYNTGVYKEMNGDGVIHLTDTAVHAVTIVIKDANGNATTLPFTVKLISLQEDDGVNNSLTQQSEFHPDYINIFENSTISFYMPPNCLYDSLRFHYAEINAGTAFPVYQLHNANVPVQQNFPVKIKGPSSYQNKMVMHRFANGKNDFKKTTFKDGWYKASFRDFGNFQLMIDTVPPTISPVGFKDGMNTAKFSSIRFVVLDNCGGLDFRAELDGNWLRFTNDKGRTFIYKFDEHCPPGEHELKITATDQVGNVAERVYRFIR
jgi:hypothetical protein